MHNPIAQHAGRLARAVFILTVFALCMARGAIGQTGSVPYHGRLASDGVAVSGEFDFEFLLFDHPDPDLGHQVGSILEVARLDVYQGRFSVDLDFALDPDLGTGVHAGRWLEVRVRQSDSDEDFIAMRPRQALAPESGPGSKSIQASPAGCSVSGDLTVDANLGVGGAPTHRLSIFGTAGEVRVPADGRQIELTASGNVRLNASGTSATLHLRVAGNDRLTVAANGRVGIGTGAPTASLDVQGALRLDSSVGLFQASPAGTDACGNVCAAQDSVAGFSAGSGACVAGWDAGGNSVGCGSFFATRCLCAGV